MPANAIVQTYAPTYPSLQYQFSNTNISLSLASGQFFPYIVGVKYSDAVDVAEARANSPYPQGSTLGEYKAQLSFTCQTLYTPLLIELLKSGSPSGQSMYDAVFQMNISYQIKQPAGSAATPVIQDVCKGCRVTGMSQDLTTGNGVLVRELACYCPLIIWNGALPLDGLPQ